MGNAEGYPRCQGSACTAAGSISSRTEPPGEDAPQGFVEKRRRDMVPCRRPQEDVSSWSLLVSASPNEPARQSGVWNTQAMYRRKMLYGINPVGVKSDAFRQQAGLCCPTTQSLIQVGRPVLVLL
jgi:hypothetical protein